MVVPPANGIDLLREHAFYEYGNKEFQSVLDFDYSFALDQFVNSNQLSLSLRFFYPLIIIAAVIFIVYSLSSYKSVASSSSGKIVEQTLLYDIETGPPPSLSYSNSSTPANSPDLSKGHHNLKVFKFDEFQQYKQA